MRKIYFNTKHYKDIKNYKKDEELINQYYNQLNKFIKDLPYTTAGRVAGKVSSFAQQQNKLK